MGSFAQEVREGLLAQHKRLSSKWLYDDVGSTLFVEIMGLDEYYLTRAEAEILSEQSAAIASALTSSSTRAIIELGPGDGSKVMDVLREAQSIAPGMRYVPVDVSREALDILARRLHRTLPGLQVEPIVGDYIETLRTIESEGPKSILFLGSNIGNYGPGWAEALIATVAETCRPGDNLLLGADLRKDPRKILAAYDDASGVTARFNLNLLARINRELDADFDLTQFSHYCLYEPESGEVRSYLVSQCEQVVEIAGLGIEVHFAEFEYVFTERSRKFSVGELKQLAEGAGFTQQAVFTDRNRQFVDCLWTKR